MGSAMYADTRKLRKAIRKAENSSRDSPKSNTESVSPHSGALGATPTSFQPV